MLFFRKLRSRLLPYGPRILLHILFTSILIYCRNSVRSSKPQSLSKHNPSNGRSYINSIHFRTVCYRSNVTLTIFYLFVVLILALYLAGPIDIDGRLFYAIHWCWDWCTQYVFYLFYVILRYNRDRIKTCVSVIIGATNKSYITECVYHIFFKL